MPVRRFRSIAEMEEVWLTPGDPALARAIARVQRQARASLDLHFPPGVYRHRCVEDLNRQQEAWDQANFEAFHRRRAEQSGQRGGGPVWARSSRTGSSEPHRD
jgi:hypothetical protein